MMKKLLCTILILFFGIGVVNAQFGALSGGGPPLQAINATATSPGPVAIAGNGTIIGTTSIGSPISQTYTFTNNAGGLYFLGTTGPTGDFSINSPTPAINNGIGTTSTFTVTFNPTAAGTQTAIVQFLASDGLVTENYFFQVQGTSTAAAPNMVLSGDDNVQITANPHLTVDDDNTDFGDAIANSETVTRSYTISNTGGANLNVTDISINPIPSTHFNVNLPPGTVFPLSIAPGFSFTFDVDFSPLAIASPLSAFVRILSDDGTNPSQLFQVRGNGVAPSPLMEVFGNSTLINSGDTSPSLTDHTDFGDQDVTAGSISRTFTIENNGTDDLDLTSLSPIVDITGANAGDFTVTTNPSTPISYIPPGNSTTFVVTFDPSAAGLREATISIANNGIDDPYTFDIEGTGTNIINNQEINLVGAGNPIFSGGGNSPAILNDTQFGTTDISSGTVVHTFTIENLGSLDLNLTDPSPFVTIGGLDAAEFSVTAVPDALVAGLASTTFNITFNPSSLGIKVATISIANDDADEDPYTFNIEGEGIDSNAGSPLLITQYYEGTGPNDNWIEVTNVSNNTVLNGTYFLHQYSDFFAIDGTIQSSGPQQSIVIGTLAPGQVALYSGIGATTPSGVNLGTPTILTSTAVCNFDGNDVILISPTTGASAYNNRIDIVGVVAPNGGTPPFWGQDKAFIKGCGTTESPSTIFDVNNYIELTLAEVDAALPGTNVQLGTQGIGPAIWTTAWNNTIPDRTRSVIISGTYNASDGDIIACDMTITGNLNFDSNTTRFVEVLGDLNIVGTFTIGDTESLLTAELITINGSITKYETTTELNQYDFTYWGSPVENAAIATVFAGTSLNDIYYWSANANNIIPFGGEEAVGEWIVATGSMIPGNGYIALGPTAGSYPLFQTVAFTGKPNNGTISLTGDPHMSATPDGLDETDFNLVGNPYPSAIDADVFLTTNNALLDETIWFWTHLTPNNLSQNSSQYAASDFATYNYTGGVGPGVGSAPGGITPPDGTIASGQGFLVRNDAAVPIARFDNNMRIRNQTGQFFRGTNQKKTIAEKDRIWLNVKSATGGAASQVLIGFLENATIGYDKGYDGLKNGAGWISLYGIVDEKKLAITGLSTFREDQVVPLGFDSYIDETITYEINIEKMEGALISSDVYLVDNVLNIVHDLKQSSYTFNLDKAEFNPTRFSLQFTKTTLGVDDLNLESDFVVSNLDNAFEVRSTSIIKELKVYDMMGRLLIDEKPMDNKFEIRTSSIRRGTIVIIKALFDDNTEASKKAIKY